MGILDRLLRRQEEKAKRADFDTLKSIIPPDRMLDRLDYMPPPEKFLKSLGGRRNIDKMMDDDEVCGVIETRMESVLATPWSLTAEDDRAVEFFKEYFQPILPKLLEHLWMAIPYGYSVTQFRWEEDGGTKYIADSMLMPHYLYQPLIDGKHVKKIDSYTQYNQEDIVLDRAKFFLNVRNHRIDRPYGQGLLYKLYYPWLFRCHGWQHWMEYLNKYGSPFLIGKTSAGECETGEPYTKVLKEVLSKAFRGSVITHDHDTDVSVVNPAQAGAQFKDFEMAVTKRIRKYVLGQTLTSDVSEGGSFAAASVHNLVREDKRRADCKLLENSVYEVFKLFALWNDYKGEIPRLELKDDATLEAARAERDVKLVQAGIITLTEEYLLERYDFKDGDFEIPESLESSISEDLQQNLSKTEQILLAKAEKERENIDKDVDELLEKDLMEQPLDDLLATIKASTDVKDLKENLALYLGEEKKEFIDELTKALFSSFARGATQDDV